MENAIDYPRGLPTSCVDHALANQTSTSGQLFQARYSIRIWLSIGLHTNDALITCALVGVVRSRRLPITLPALVRLEHRQRTMEGPSTVISSGELEIPVGV